MSPVTTAGTETTHPERIMALDALRGICAIGVMCYHSLLFLDVANLRAIGSYGVYTFFVLSGFAMSWVYRTNTGDSFPVRSFYVARLARIVPLLWAAFAVKVATGLPPGTTFQHVVENVTLLGALSYGESLLVGGWSIQVEIVFYLVFPALLLLLRGPRSLGAFIAVALAVRLITIEAIWPKGVSLAGGPRYQQIPSFLVFFAAGMLLAELRRSARPTRSTWPLAAGLVVLGGVFVANSLSDKALIAGITGVAMTVACCAAVGFAAWTPNPTGKVARVAFETLGAVSYATYLLHPLVYSAVKRLSLGTSATFGATVVTTLVAAWCSNRLFETPSRDLIRRRLAPAQRAY